jgi:peptide/nickel transport system substrate-binding protein
MKRFKRFLALLLAMIMVFSLSACDKPENETNTEPKTLKVAASFAYPSLDVHKESYGWYTSIYGISETLFKMGNDSSIQPGLAEKADNDGKTWTIILKDGICFSNGEPVTAEMVVRNLQRAAEVNTSYAFLAEYEMATVDNKSFTVTCPELYPTLPNDLADSALGIIDLDNTTDFDNAPICTGPFVISEFIPEGDVTVTRNEKYWGGKAKLDGAVFYYMQEDEPKLMAMQNGEIDCYNSVSSAALEIYQADPDAYKLTIIPATRLQFYILNKNQLSDNIREAINLTVDKESIAAFLKGTVSAAVGPFSTATAYGKVTVPAVDTAKAKELIEADGYTLNANGIYEKNGRPLSINIAYYAARSLDTLATLIQEQLKAIGIDSTLTVEEDPDSTYIATGNFDLALYCMIADKSGDPYYFIERTIRDGGKYNCGGFKSEEAEALSEKLKYEPDTAKRAELANQIIQIAIDDNAFGYVGLFNNTTVMRPGVSGYAEKCPFDFYGIDASTDIQ